MGTPRTLLLFDRHAQPASWDERMAPGEYAVHYSSFSGRDAAAGPTCSVLPSLAEAEAYARQQVALDPTLRCRIYDTRGLVDPPVREIRGAQHKALREISPRFCKWVGAALFFAGLALIALDWSRDFRLSWPAMIGVRMLIPGLVLLLTYAVLLVQARRKPDPLGRGAVS